jgi:hypothetical protein
MDTMTSQKKVTAAEELGRIDKAIDESILGASASELREEMAAEGEDAEKTVKVIDAAIARAKTTGGKRRLAQAKAELEERRNSSGSVVKLDREIARARFKEMKSKDPELASKMMMAARDGQGLSESDLEGLLDDIVELDGLDPKVDEK